MKATKKIVGATAALVAAVALSAGSTFAWFATNDTVTAGGMSVSVTTSDSYLVISDTISDFDGAGTAVNFTGGTKALKPSTHDDSAGDVKLKYVNNPSSIDPETGLKDDEEGTADLTYTNVVKSETNESEYYYDYIVYLANVGGQLASQTLTLTFDKSTTDVSANPILNAVSVDIYFNDVFDSTVNIKEMVAASGDHIVTESGVTIPSTEADGFKVTMRVYVDGALTVDGGSSAYVNSASVRTAACAFTVNFSI